jgi:hypothetical protein
VIVFASLIEVTPDYVARITAQEEADGRFAADPEGMKARGTGGRLTFRASTSMKCAISSTGWTSRSISTLASFAGRGHAGD